MPEDLASADMLRVLADMTTTVATEFTDTPLPVSGELPHTLNGVYLRNGPGRFERGGQRYRHPFDGDGHITKLEIAAGKVQYTNRFVRTQEYIAEEGAERMLYRAFGTNLPGGLPANLFRIRFKNAANTNVCWHAGRLLALWEGGPPHRLEPRTLATLGCEDFDGQLQNPLPPPSRWLAPLLPFSAHPRLDAETNTLYNFGLVAGATNRLMLYRIGPDGRLAKPRAHKLKRFSFVHDFAVSKQWLCFLMPHADFAVPQALLGFKSAVDSLRIATERPMQVLLLPRQQDPGQPASRGAQCLEGPPGFVYHIAQAFDDDHGRLVLDVIRYPGYLELADFESLFREPAGDFLPRLERLLLDPVQQRWERLSLGEAVTQQAFELPTAAPGPLGRSQRLLYGVGAPPERRVPYLTAIQRLDTETGQLTTRDFGLDVVGEPILVPGSDGDEGWLLALVHRAQQARTELVILRAADLTQQATVTLPHTIPFGFHGCWIPGQARSG